MSVLVDIEETAELLHASPRTIRKWYLDGHLPGVRIGRKIRFHADIVLGVAANGLDLSKRDGQ